MQLVTKLYVFVIAVVFKLNNRSSTYTYSKISKLSANDFVTKNVSDLKTKFGVGDIPFENKRLPKMLFMLRLHNINISFF